MTSIFTTGQLSKMFNISKQTLILYERKELFVPQYVDPQTQYRYYTQEQLSRLAAIRELKASGFSLEEIKDFLDTNNLYKTVAALERQQAIIEKQIHQLQMVMQQIQGTINTLKYSDNIATNACPSIQHCSPMNIVIFKVVDTPNIQQKIIKATKLYNEVINSEQFIQYITGVIVSSEDLILNNFDTKSQFFSVIDPVTENAKYDILPGGLYATYYHIGSTQDMTHSYQYLLDFIQKEGYQITGGSFEFHLIDGLSTQRIEDYITSIHIPVKLISKEESL